MSPVVACMVCGPPLGALLTSGLHAGVFVMAVVAVAVITLVARAAVRLLREDGAALDASRSQEGAR